MEARVHTAILGPAGTRWVGSGTLHPRAAVPAHAGDAERGGWQTRGGLGSLLSQMGATSDFREGMSALMQKRKPTFRGE